MLLFSATYDQEVMKFAESIIPNPIILRLRREEESLDNIKQYYVFCKTEQEKYTAISNIYGVITIGQAIIFCQVWELLWNLVFKLWFLFFLDQTFCKVAVWRHV